MRKRAILLVTGVLLALTGCYSTINGTSQISTRSEKLNFTHATEIKETELVIEPGMEFHTLSIRKINLSSGAIKFTLIGPDESVVWEQAFADSTDFQRDLTLDAIQGKWLLRIELTNATGSYDLVWRGANTP